MPDSDHHDYHTVQLANGAWSLRSRSLGETFHPVIGPSAEAETLYVRQLKLHDRIQTLSPKRAFVIWDVGLGAAANALAALRSLESFPGSLHLVSFDRTLDPLRVALASADRLPYLHGYEPAVRQLLDSGSASLHPSHLHTEWTYLPGDFCAWLQSPPPAPSVPAPDAIFFDAFSPARNPDMWTLQVFQNLHARLDPSRPCSLATYTRSTFARVSLLLAGFYVGAGDATGEKEETTVAATHLDLLQRPLSTQWLQRVQRSNSAEPLFSDGYRQRPLRPEFWEKLLQHPQFQPPIA